VRVGATLRIDGQWIRLHGRGSGPVDAFAAALQAAFGLPMQVLDYHEHAIGAGAQARAAAYIEMRVGSRVLHGVGVDADIVAASFKALLCGAARAGALGVSTAEATMAD
jgi:2-isopropylmalate synthase